jgi:transcriptional regulator with XRE-family HTH domain
VDGLRREEVAQLAGVSVDYLARLEQGYLTALIPDLRDRSPRFAALWEEHPVARVPARTKTFVHPEIGEITLDCDVLSVQGSDLSVVVYTAAPGSSDARALALLATIGLQALSG